MKKNNVLPLFYLFSLVVSVLIGVRSHDVGSDTIMYIEHFDKSGLETNQLDRFEPGFELLMLLINKLGGNADFFFFLIAFIITLTYLIFFKNICLQSKKNHFVNLSDFSIIFTCLLFSNWYLTLTTNGIRQGVSIVLLYMALYYLVFLKKRWVFLTLFLFSISFHYSSLIVLPFIFLLRFNLKSIFILWLLFGVFYIFDINEHLIFMLSDGLNLPLYEFIKLYSLEKGQLPGTGLYEGFNSLFFAYTIFWPILLFIIIKSFPLKSLNHHSESVLKVVSCYLILCLPYFIFGFGPFANRYAFFAWFLVPLVQYFILTSLNVDKISLKLTGSFFLLALMYFCLFQLNWKIIL